MAKELPYFKFYVSEWNDGDITLEEMHIQGVFVNVCSYYWSNECRVTLDTLNKKFRPYKKDIEYLIKEGLIKVNNNEVIIAFLCTQLCERGGLSVQNSSNAKKGWEKRRAKEALNRENNATASIPQSESDTESMQYREEKRREEKKRKDIDFIYSLYPTKCIVKGNQTGKSTKDKEKIKSLMVEKSKEELESIITRYVKECKDSKTFMKNFKTFLNNLPDYTETEKPEIDEDYIYFRWMNDPSVFARRVLKTEAEKLFEGQAMGGYTPKILKSIKNKKTIWN